MPAFYLINSLEAVCDLLPLVHFFVGTQHTCRRVLEG